jgi:hypothetical protein
MPTPYQKHVDNIQHLGQLFDYIQMDIIHQYVGNDPNPWRRDREVDAQDVPEDEEIQ